MKVPLMAVGALCLAGCYSTGDGPDPTSGLYFPVGVAVSPGGHALYVANSDFDLQFNGGTVQAYHLDDIRNFLHPVWSQDSSNAANTTCVELGLGPDTNQLLYPGACGALNLDAPPPKYFATDDNKGRPLAGIAKIGAFATDLLFVCRPSSDLTTSSADCSRGVGDPMGARLFVPVRGDPSLTFFDVDDDRLGQQQTFRLDCGQAGNNGRCNDDHRTGIDPNDNTRGLKLPAEPFSIAVSDRADAIAISHQIPGGAVSLFTGQGVGGGSVMDVKPRLEFVATGLPAGATGLAALPIPAVVSALGQETNYQEGFVATYRGAAQADIFRFFDDRLAAPARPFLARVSAFGLGATPSGLDSRGIAIDRGPRSQRATCERSCAADDTDCLAECSRIPLSLFVTNRFGSVGGALLAGEVSTLNPTGSSENLLFYESVPLAQGASRIVVGKIRNREGNDETRVFAICFDARVIFVYDPERRRVDGQIRTGRGPHALAMDPNEPIAYLAHFTDSYIGLVDLDQSHSGTYASVVATIGMPTPPKEARR
jgi:hypothetical protein